MLGGNFRGASVRSWFASAVGCGPSALARCCHRRRWDEVKGQSRTATRRDSNQAEPTGAKREVAAGSTIGRWPNEALQRIAARWRFCLKPNEYGWTARAEGER